LFPLFAPVLSHPQIASERQVKAAYLYNFAKFVEWPTDRLHGPASPVKFCLLSEASFAEELNRIVNGKTVAEHPIAIAAVQRMEQARDCHILFIDSAHDGESRRILEGLGDASVLTVGEKKGFLEKGGTINFVLQGDYIKFEVNRRAAIRVGLQISSRLLMLAQRTIE
jgi:hypothetical protein